MAYGKRQYDIQSKMRTRIVDIFHSTIHFERTSDAHNAEMIRLIWDDAECKRLSQRRREYLHAIADTLWSQLYDANMGHKPPLEWVLIGTDGRQFREGNDDWLKESDEYKSTMQANSTHAWRSALDKGVLKRW
jgi:hypothetical protein